MVLESEVIPMWWLEILRDYGITKKHEVERIDRDRERNRDFHPIQTNFFKWDTS